MSWAAQCKTMLKEDKVHYLLETFGVFYRSNMEKEEHMRLYGWKRRYSGGGKDGELRVCLACLVRPEPVEIAVFKQALYS